VKSDVAVGVDIGGTKMAAGLVGRNGLLGDLRIVATEASSGGREVLRRAIALAQSVASNSQASAVGIASGGWLESSSGRVVFATELLPGWTGVDLRAEFERANGLPAFAVNDVHAMGLAEGRLGAGVGHMLCLTVAVGTGIGGAFTVEGGLFRGAHGMAGAVGQIWSGGGTIESQVSGPGIAAAFARCVRLNRSRVGLPDVVKARRSADARLRECARRVTEQAGTALGHVVAGVANTIDPDVIVIGGGAALALGSPFLRAIRAAVRDQALSPIRAEVVPARLGVAAGVIGAGLLALESR